VIFIDNKYSKWYFSIINNAKSRISIDGYIEKHHIIPKSLGGNNKKENIIALTAREHFICHSDRMTYGCNRQKMAFASNMMLCGSERYIPCSRIYKIVKDEFSKHISKIHTGKVQTEESNIKRSIAQKGIPKGPQTEDHKRNNRLSKKGKPSGRKGISLSTKGKTYEEIYGPETSKKLIEIRSKAWPGRKGFQKSGKDNPNARSIIVNGINYGSMKDACKSLNITYYSLYKLIS
jgi:hypothetical protein